MAEELKPDICVIGGGPAGIAVAIAAANAEVPVVLVEGSEMGGVNVAAAVPSKALVAAASRYESLRVGPAFGVTGAPLQVNLGKVHDHLRSATEAVAANGSAERLTALGATVVKAQARFVDGHTVVAGDTTIRAKHFVIATGAKPVIPDVPGLGEVDYLTFETIFDATRKMGHLIVLGADRYGLEIAQAYTRLGIDATVIDDGPALADEDPELAALVLERLRAEGIRVRDRTRILGVARRRGGIRATVAASAGSESEEIPVDGTHILVAPSRRAANIGGLGLDKAGIDHDGEGIKVDPHLRTTNNRVHAIGDVIAGPAGVNRAEHQAAMVAKRLLRQAGPATGVFPIPSMAMTDPALAAVGLDENEARRKHKDVRVLRLPFAESDLNQADRATSGLLKVIVTDRGQILGAAAVGREAGEVIALWSLAIANRLTIDAMQTFVAPYPTRADLSRRIAESFTGPGLTPPPRRRIIDFLRKSG